MILTVLEIKIETCDTQILNLYATHIYTTSKEFGHAHPYSDFITIFNILG